VDPNDRSWSTIALAVVLGVIVLYIPALALLGMEHTLQCALVLYAFVLFERLQRKQLTLGALTPLLGIVFLASLVRFETAFVAVGFAVTFFAGTLAHLGDAETRARWTRPAALRAAVLVGLAATAPIVGLGLVNLSFGHDFLPNSIVSKSDTTGDLGLGALVRDPLFFLSKLGRDPLVLVLALLAMLVVIWAWSGGPRRVAVPAAAFFVTVVLHRHFANFGWYERYQTYLIVVGIYLAFQLLAELTPQQFRTAAKVSLVLAVVVLSATRIDLTVSAPRASSNTYRQRYQLGRFLEREYDKQPVATSELGYPSLFHEGPLVDVLGLGSHEVLDLIEGPDWNDAAMADLLEQEHVQVYSVFSEYPIRPRGWQQVGLCLLDERIVPGPTGRVLEFWAPPGAAARQLRRKLERFQSSLPSRVVAAYPDRNPAGT
jgi:hypothetical protein